MRLQKIKLSGFKSFVDQTTVPLKNNLVAVVGPNGCGKSNIIDAIRWVMGESSAKHLRGSCMADVIFNGSEKRNPVGQAQIELIFDNSDHKIIGQYANYNEISVKRTVTRDGQSNYYLNNSKCRRRDIADVFLGTGLGARSYAIIEQGMISKIIEAKPEELRAHLEEAAGISKYKERRKETETRMQNTKDNLTRLNDIMHELDKQIIILEKQSQVAKKYKLLKAEEFEVKVTSLVLKFNNLRQKAEKITEYLKNHTEHLDKLNLEKSTINTEINKFKAEEEKLLLLVQKASEEFYKSENLINRIEQEIKQIQDENNRLLSDQSYIKQSLENNKTNVVNLEKELDELEIRLKDILPDVEYYKSQNIELKQKLNSYEQEEQNWETKWRDLQQQKYSLEKVINNYKSDIEKYDTLIMRAEGHKNKLQEEQGNFSSVINQDAKIQLINDDINKLNENLFSKKDELKIIEQDILEKNKLIAEYEKEFNSNQHELHQLRGRLSSLETIQEHALGKQHKKQQEWLKKHELDKNKRLAEILDVNPDWSKVVESIVYDNIASIKLGCFDNLKTLLSNDLNNASASFFINNDQTLNYNHKTDNSYDDLVLLSSKIKNFELVSAFWPGNIYCLDSVVDFNDQISINALLVNVDLLKNNDSIVTKNGIWINKNWLKVLISNNNQKESNGLGVLEREKEIKQLINSLDLIKDNIELIKSNINLEKEVIQKVIKDKNLVENNIKHLLQQESTNKLNLAKLEMELKQQKQNENKLKQELLEIENQISNDTLRVKELRTKLEDSINKFCSIEKAYEGLDKEGIIYKGQLKKIREEYSLLKEKVHKIEIQKQEINYKLDSVKKELTEKVRYKEKSLLKLEDIDKKLERLNPKLIELQESLKSSLESKEEKGQNVALNKDSLAGTQNNIKKLEQEISNYGEKLLTVNNQITNAKLQLQDIDTRKATIEESLMEEDANLDELLDKIDLDSDYRLAEKNLKIIQTKVSSLGNVNLMAIEEFDKQTERKEYYVKQQDDLEKALEILEQAIAKIDKETIENFKQTFDIVNQELQYLFPKVFIGGEAKLILTGEGLLDSGVSIMARPPGKKNSSINLLSGGEKTLTAIALVFAIFRLNPAPFCLLDEVDAPLDDANVGRFCSLVKEMAKDVQFIFITHNKITMALAEKLIGVTMGEPGVSRLVSVDIEQAAELAQK
tara:strand:- start:13719 stop:17297 length:3579 start_codon:yes stop_codon:yes gene_type:complete